MKQRLGTLLFVITLALGMAAATVVVAGNAADVGDTAGNEAEREREATLAAEAAGPTTARRGSVAATATMTAPLFAGVNDPTVFAHAIDPDTNDFYPLFDGLEVWGAAYDAAGDTVYLADGAELYAWSVGGAVSLVGTFYVGDVTTTTVVLSGLAYHNGILYGARTVGGNSGEGIYTIDPATAQATLAFTYAAGASAADIGGIAIHPVTGVLYGTNDQSESLVAIGMDGSLVTIAPYPDGEDDIDGLAIGRDNRAYLIPDEPGLIYVYDFDSLTYATPLTNPWESNHIFSGGTWVSEPVTPSLALTKTVGLDANDCAASDELSIPAGTEVIYCYAAENTGNVPLTFHDLNDSELGDILTGFEFELSPGASVWLTQTATITDTTVNTAMWTGYNPGPIDSVTVTDTATVTVVPPSIALTKTVGLDPNVCATTTALSVDPGTEVTYCFEVTNTSLTPFALHDLSDTQLGQILSGTNVLLNPSASVFVTATAQISATTVNTATWTAYNETPEDGASAMAVALVTVILPEEPEIDVSPAAFSATLGVDEMMSATLTISNTGTADLGWTITEAAPTCATPKALAWAEADPPAGITGIGAARSVVVTLDSTGLAAGDYEGALCIASNDSDEPLVEVPLALAVIEPPDYVVYLAVIAGSPAGRR